MKTCGKTGFGHCSDAEPYVFTFILISMFPTPCVFAVVLDRFGLAVAQWIAALAADFKRNELKNIRFWKHPQQNVRKNVGFCVGKSPEPVSFSSYSCRLIKIPMNFLGSAASSEGLPMPPPAGPGNGLIRAKTALARSHFRKADQIEIPCIFECSQWNKTL